MGLFSGFLVVLTPFVLSLLLADALHAAINAAVVPKSFVRRQFMYAFFVLPIIDLFARVWLLQPFVPALALLAAAVVAAAVVLHWALHRVVGMANHTAMLTSSVHQIIEYAQAEVISSQLQPKCHNLTHSVQTLFTNLNYTRLSADADHAFTKYLSIANQTGFDSGVQYIELLGNFSRTPVLMEARRNLSNILNNSLHSAQFTDLIRNGESYNNESLIFDELKSNLTLLFDRLSFENTSSEGPFVQIIAIVKTTWPAVEERFNALRLSLGSRTPQIVSSSTISAEAKRTLDEILKVAAGQHSLRDAFRSLLLTPATETKEAYQMCDAYDFLHVEPRWVVALLTLMLISVPFMYIGRTLLQSLIQWHLSKTYRHVANEAQREIDGYILTGGVTGIGFGAAQATIQALLWAFLPFSAQAKLVLLVHCAMLMVIHCVTQMAINGAEGRRDLMFRWKGRKAWWILTTAVHVVTAMWWTAQYLSALVCALLRVDTVLGLLLVADAVVLAIYAWWGRSICRRARSDEACHSRRE